MTRNQTILAVLAAAAVAWGCGQTPTAQQTSSAPGQSKSLEARVAKLEAELKAAQSHAADADAKWKAEQARAQALEKERDGLQVSLKVRTTERDNVQAQYDGFRKSLRELVGQMDAAAAPPAPAGPAVPSGPVVIPTVIHTAPPPRGL